MVAPPSGFASMSLAAVQTFVVSSNLERVDRGLQPAAGMVDMLNSLSSTAAGQRRRPGAAQLEPDRGRSAPTAGAATGPATSTRSLRTTTGCTTTAGVRPAATTSTAPAPPPPAAGATGTTSSSSYRRLPGRSPASGAPAQSQWNSIAQIFVAGAGPIPLSPSTWSQVTSPSQTASPSTAGPGPRRADATALSVSAPPAIVAGQVRHRLRQAHRHPRRRAQCRTQPVHACSRATTSVRPRPATTVTTGQHRRGPHDRPPEHHHVVLARLRRLRRCSSSRDEQPGSPRRTPGCDLARNEPSSTGWRVNSHLTPARGQTVRLQRHTSSGWVTVRRTTARSWMSFTRLHAERSRLMVWAISSTGHECEGARVAELSKIRWMLLQPEPGISGRFSCRRPCGSWRQAVRRLVRAGRRGRGGRAGPRSARRRGTPPRH